MINLPIIKHCPNCGNTISESDIEFCTECGHNLSKKPIINDSKRFFDILAEKTNLSIIIFSFIIFGVLLFLGSIFWSSFVSDASIDLITYLILCVVIPVFVVGIFVGYFGCKDKSYVVPNVIMFIASIFAVLLTDIALIFTIFIGLIAKISSAFSQLSNNSVYGTAYQPTNPVNFLNINLSGIFEIVLFVMLIPLAAYFGIYLGYLLKENI